MLMILLIFRIGFNVLLMMVKMMKLHNITSNIKKGPYYNSAKNKNKKKTGRNYWLKGKLKRNKKEIDRNKLEMKKGGKNSNEKMHYYLDPTFNRIGIKQ